MDEAMYEMVAYFEAKNTKCHVKQQNKETQWAENQPESNAKVNTLEPDFVMKLKCVNTGSESATKNPSDNETRKRNHQSLSDVDSINLSISSSSSSFGFHSPKVAKKYSNISNVLQYGKANEKHKHTYGSSPELLKKKCEEYEKQKINKTWKRNETEKLEAKPKDSANASLTKSSTGKRGCPPHPKKSPAKGSSSASTSKGFPPKCGHPPYTKKSPAKGSSSPSTTKSFPRKRGRPVKPKNSSINSSLSIKSIHNLQLSPTPPSKMVHQTLHPSKLVEKNKLQEIAAMQNKFENVNNKTEILQFMNRQHLEKMITIKRSESFLKEKPLINFIEMGSNSNLGKYQSEPKLQKNVGPSKACDHNKEKENSGFKRAEKRIYNKNLSIATTIKQPPTTKSSPKKENTTTLWSNRLVMKPSQDISIDNNFKQSQPQGKPTAVEKRIDTIFKGKNPSDNYLQSTINYMDSDLTVNTKQYNNILPKIWDSPETIYPNSQNSDQEINTSLQKNNFAPLCPNVDSGVKTAERRMYNKNFSIASTSKQPPTRKPSPQNDNITTLWPNEMGLKRTLDIYNVLPKIWDSPEASYENSQNNGQGNNTLLEKKNFAPLYPDVNSGEQSSPLYTQTESCKYKKMNAIGSNLKQSKGKYAAAVLMPSQKANVVSEVQQKYKKKEVNIIGDIQLTKPYTALQQKPVDSLKNNVTSGVESILHQKVAQSIANNLKQPNVVSKVGQKYKKNKMNIISDIQLSKPYTALQQKPVDSLKNNVISGLGCALHEEGAPSITNNLKQANVVSEVQQKYKKKKVNIISDIQLSKSYIAPQQKPVTSLENNVISEVGSTLHQEVAPSIANNLEQLQPKAFAEAQFSLEENPQDNFLLNLPFNTTKKSKSPETSNVKPQNNEQELNASPVWATDSDSREQVQDVSLISFNIEQPEKPFEITEDLFLNESVIKILQTWVQTTPVPDDDDIDKISNGIYKLLKLGLYDKVYNGMLYLCRLINKYRNSTKYCYWHRSYLMMAASIKVYRWEDSLLEPFKFGENINCKACNL